MHITKSKTMFAVSSSKGGPILLEVEETRPAWDAQGVREYAQVSLSVEEARALQATLTEHIAWLEAE